SGVLGGIGAGGAGLGLGFLGQQLFGGAGAGAAAFGGGSGFATGALIGSIVPGIGTLIGGLIGGLSGVFGGLFGQTKQMKANRSRDQQMADLAERFGLTGTSGTGIGSTFHNIAARLTEATGEHGGGRLFQQLIKAETVEEVNRAIAAVTKTLEEYEARTRSAADAEAQHQQEIGQTTDAYAQQRRELEAQL